MQGVVFNATYHGIRRERLKGNIFKISIISMHAPTEEKEDNEHNVFYEALGAEI